MPKIPISDARAGQRLTRPAATRAGMVMVQAGTELTPALIERLRNLGISSVFVAGEKGAAGDKPLDVALRELDERFLGHEDDAWMMAVKAIVRRQLQGGGDHA